jgi:hypothetical protein
VGIDPQGASDDQGAEVEGTEGCLEGDRDPEGSVAVGAGEGDRAAQAGRLGAGAEFGQGGSYLLEVGQLPLAAAVPLQGVTLPRAAEIPGGRAMERRSGSPSPSLRVTVALKVVGAPGRVVVEPAMRVGAKGAPAAQGLPPFAVTGALALRASAEAPL